MKGIEVQLNQDEPETIEFIIADENCHFTAYFGLSEWKNFKKAVNEFNIDHPLSVIANVDAKNTGLKISITDMQTVGLVTVEFYSDFVSSLIDFSRAGWKKFKTDINTFRVAKRERVRV